MTAGEMINKLGEVPAETSVVTLDTWAAAETEADPWNRDITFEYDEELGVVKIS